MSDAGSVTEPKWLGQLPPEQETAFPECDDDVVDLHDQRFAGASLVAATVTERPEIINVAFDQCDIVGLVANDGRADRVLMTGSRLRGVTWSNGLIRDARFLGVLAMETSFRFTELRRVGFRDCKLPGVDFTRATFDDVRFENCELVGATFEAARLNGQLRIEHCNLTGCSGVQALRGASIHADDLISLGPSMAEALGFRVE
jgi:uncharacterized protein YjbI with pentapeptide repeats